MLGDGVLALPAPDNATLCPSLLHTKLQHKPVWVPDHDRPASTPIQSFVDAQTDLFPRLLAYVKLRVIPHFESGVMQTGFAVAGGRYEKNVPALGGPAELNTAVSSAPAYYPQPENSSVELERRFEVASI